MSPRSTHRRRRGIPTSCRSCGAALTGADAAGADPAPNPHQVAELPEVRPDVVEYRLGPTCPCYREAIRAPQPPGGTTGVFGPRFLATIALLTGAYRLSKRQVPAALADLLRLELSVGMVCKAERLDAEAVAVPVEEVSAVIATAPALGVDETGWREARRRAWLWTAKAGSMTLFRIDRSRVAEALRRLVVAAIVPVITSDRFSTRKVVPASQVCWAHLRRDF